MANDAEWVADVKRWYFSSQHPVAAAAAKDEPRKIACEAADPATNPATPSRQWRDAPRAGVRKLN